MHFVLLVFVLTKLFSQTGAYLPVLQTIMLPDYCFPPAAEEK